jgi:orotate phosphoribosyltransferase
MSTRIEIAGDHHLETLRRCGGYYSCPKDNEGCRIGPLVGYAGNYEDNGQQKQFVGEVYANFAKAEEHSNVLKFFAGCISSKLIAKILHYEIVLCGAPIGGYALSVAIGLYLSCRVVKAEKKVTALATATKREQSDIIFSRHLVELGKRYVIVEDVCNNFSTTEKLINLIWLGGGEVLAIVCFLNRSLTVEAQYYSSTMSRDIPVMSLVHLPINEWKQNDPAVVNDITKNNVVWKPKHEWSRLMDAMKRKDN